MPGNALYALRDLPPFIRRRDLACRPADAALFHDDDPTRAKQVCRDCPVRAWCREWAIATDQIGVWGATTTIERTWIRKKRERGAAA